MAVRRVLGLAAVLVVAFALRVWGIDVGRGLGTPLGFSYHVDEPNTMARALQMTESLDPNPHWFMYPSLFLYANFAALEGASLLPVRPDPYILGRLLTVLFGTATVGVVFLFGRRLGGYRAGMLAAAVLAVAFLHVRSSHFVTTDVPMTLFCTLVGWLALRFFDSGRRRDLIAAFAAAGLAMGTKYNGAPAVLMPALAAALQPRDRLLRRALHVLAGGVLFLGVFVATTPFLVVEPATFAHWFRFIHDYQVRGQFGFERPGFVANLTYLASYLFWKGVGPVATLLAVAGMVTALRPGVWRRSAPPVLFAVSYLLWLATYRTSFTRNMMPIVPVLAAYAGFGLDRALAPIMVRPTTWGRRTVPAATVLATVIVVAWPVQQSVRYDLAISHSTRTISIPWILNHLPPGSHIATEIYGPPLEYTHPGRYRLRSLWNFGKNVPFPGWFRASGVDFIISNSGAWEMVFSNPGQYPDAERLYRGIDRLYPVIKVFEGDTVDPLYSSISPTIKIYDCRRRIAHRPASP